MGKELELAIKISGKLDKSLSSAVHSAQAQLNSIAKVTNRAMTAATAAVAVAGVKLVKDSVQTYQDYQSALNSAAATGNIARGTAEYEAMNNAAREAGRTTVKTAKESANALEYMMLAGWSVENSTKALMPVLKLSASTGADLATTSDLVTDSMANLGLTIDDLPHYLDVAAAANNKTNQTATQLQEAYLGVGGTLKNINAPIEDSAAILGVLANRGTKGSEAGTALSAILVNMQKRSGEAYKAMNQLGVSMYDTNGNARSIIDVFQDISDKTSGMTEENRNLMYQMIGGKSHVDSFSKIMQGFNTQTADGTTEVYSLIDAFKNCDGALDKLYDIKMDTLEGSVFRLSSAFDDMKISIGERLAPTLQGAFDNLANKMPQIGDVIISSLEKIIPTLSKALNYLVNNSEKAVAGAIKMAKAFAMIKIGSGVIKGVDGTIKLVSNLNKISKAVGGLKMLQGLIGTFTGISAAAVPAAAAIAGIVTAVALYKKVQQNMSAEYRMDRYVNSLGKASESLVKYNNLAQEVSQLKLVIANSDSTVEELDTAKHRLQEIADMIGLDYSFDINCDTTELDAAINKMRALSRDDLFSSGKGFLNSAKDAAGKYQENLADADFYSAQAKEAEHYYNAYESLIRQGNAYISGYESGFYDDSIFLTKMTELQGVMRDYGIDDIYGNLGNAQAAISMVQDWNKEWKNWGGTYAEAAAESEKFQKKVDAFDSNTVKAADYLTQALASDTQIGDRFGIDSDIAMLTELGQVMTKAGVNTDNLATQFSTAKAGYTDFAEAINNGKAGEMAQSFLDYQKEIGQTAENAVQGAALIQNGFQSAEQATAAGGDAINNVLTSLKSLGDMQGIFNGITNDDGVADKLSDMAHAMNLIPENKSVTVDANGNFQVIEEAENQIASLKSVGNVDVSVNTNGDFSVLNEVTGEIQTLQGSGAVSLQVNAQGNIDVLNDANVAIAQIDKQTGKVIYVDASVEPGAVETGGFKEKVGAVLKNIFGTMTAYAEEMPVDVNVKPGNINTASFDSVFMQRSQALFGGQPKTVNIAVNGQVSGMEQLSNAQQIASRLRSTFVTQTVAGSYPGQEQIVAAVDNQSKLASVATTQTVNGSFPGQAAIATAIWYQNQLCDKTVTHKVIYEQVGTPPANNAAGTTHFKGGLTYVNDQNISDPREVIEHNGMRYWFEGRNVLANVPKGARIYNASQSKPIINGSHRGGLARVPFDGYIAELHRNEQVLTADEASEYRDGGFSDYMRKMKVVLEHRDGSGQSSGNGKSGGESNITFSPTYVIQGNGDKETIREASRMSFNDFKRFMEEYERDKRRKSFSN